MMHLPPHLFREYDIRGVFPSALSESAAEQIAHAFGLKVSAELKISNPKICVGWDGRKSSPSLKVAVSKGLMRAGVEVLEIGIGPTPMTYFAVFHENADGCVMITGSHNPPDHNGLKMMIGTAPFYGAQIQELRDKIADGKLDENHGSIKECTIRTIYIDTLLNAAKLDQKPLNVVWDCGNGAAGEVVQALVKQLAGKHHVLFGEIDGAFPNHHPDPSDPHNLEDLQREVLARSADLGIAFDGDGDRIGVVDSKGRIIAGDQLLAIVAPYVLRENSGATIIADVKTSKAVFDAIEQAGGKALMWKTGHSNIKAKMKETGALLAGEMSGHMFFADKYFGFDDAIYAAIRVLDMIANSPNTLAEMLDDLPKMHSTAELRMDCDDERKFEIIAKLVRDLEESGADFSAIDGVRVNTPDGWWLIRASNTQPVLVARAEAATKEGLERVQAEMNLRLKLQ
jgi:phosphomannomutase